MLIGFSAFVLQLKDSRGKFSSLSLLFLSPAHSVTKNIHLGLTVNSGNKKINSETQYFDSQQKKVGRKSPGRSRKLEKQKGGGRGGGGKEEEEEG